MITFLRGVMIWAGNLSMHLMKLEQKALIEIEKGFAGKYPTTVVHLSDAGRKAIARHWL